MAAAPWPFPRLKAPFELLVTWPADRFGRVDADNPLKPLPAYLQRIETIDRYGRRLLVEFRRPWLSCRVALRAYGGEADLQR